MGVVAPVVEADDAGSEGVGGNIYQNGAYLITIDQRPLGGGPLCYTEIGVDIKTGVDAQLFFDPLLDQWGAGRSAHQQNSIQLGNAEVGPIQCGVDRLHGLVNQ